MEIITWAEFKERRTDKKGFALTHYSKLFDAAHCRVNIKGLDFQLGYDDRYTTEEWNNQVNQFEKAHLDHFVEITAEVAEEIKTTLSAYEADVVVVKDHLSTGLSGFDYNIAIAKKAHLKMMVAKYAKMVELLPTFAADEDEKTGDAMSYDEIVKAIEQGKKVYWINSAYRVFLENGKLYEINVYNMSMCALEGSQYKDCFIEGVKNVSY